MTTPRKPTRRLVAGACFAMMLGAARAPAAEPRAPTDGTAESVIKDWPRGVRATARMLIERYGPPSKAGANELVWTDNGPWLRTTLHKDGLTRAMLGRTKDRLEQTIAYAVPEDKVAELRRYDSRITVNRDAGELTSLADTESRNYLALNLADDIIKGHRTAREAGAFALRARLLENSGKSSPYLEGLIFPVTNRRIEGSGPPAPEPEPLPERMYKPDREDYIPRR